MFRRDGGCVPALLRAPGLCRDRFGAAVSRHDLHAMTVEHVQEGYGRTGKRATSDPAHCLTGCWGHTVQRWELAHKYLLRLYLAEVNVPGVPARIAAQRALDRWEKEEAGG